METAPVKPGDVLAGKYRVDRVLGQGGMGVVVAATHIEMQQPRAIKLMLRSAMSDAEAVERFMREADLATRLDSEHIAKVYEIGRLDTGVSYMVMEYLEGDDLKTVAQGRAVPVPEAVYYLLQICEALAEAHASGIVHRDIKPSNVFVTSRPGQLPCLKVLDFGVSRIVSDSSEYSTVTKSYSVIGSPHYMSPEQMRSPHDVDARTDIWSLGVIAYQLVTGRLPFGGRTVVDLMSDVVGTAPEPPSQIVPGIPADLERAILRCLEKERDGRYADANEVAAALRPFAPSAHVVQEGAEAGGSWTRSAAFVAGALVIAVALAFAAQRIRSPPAATVPSARPTSR